jgi:predicted ATP-dependent endonuclease of OLD family
MKLHIENFRKIASADLELNGLTVVIGDNNTGKSTIGKLLFSIVDLFSSVEQGVKSSRRSFVMRGDRLPKISQLDIDSLIEDKNLTEGKLFDILRSVPEVSQFGDEIATKANDAKKVSSWLSLLSRELFSRIVDARNIPMQALKSMHIGIGLNNYFNGSVLSQTSDDSKNMNVFLESEGNKIEIQSSSNTLTFSGDMPMINRAWFVGGPSLLSLISQERQEDFTERVHTPLLRKMYQLRDGDVFATTIASSKLKPIIDKLRLMLPGNFERRKNFRILDFNSEEYPIGIPVESLSMGLKVFALLRLMLERGVLREGDILILDEPENNLHPKWQLKFAEIITELQEMFKLKILLTTHSPYFLDAVRLYSCKNNNQKHLKIYSANELSQDNTLKIASRVEVCDITNDKEAMYRPFSSPLREMRNMLGEV